jgi:hypothetical protein
MPLSLESTTLPAAQVFAAFPHLPLMMSACAGAHATRATSGND